VRLALEIAQRLEPVALERQDSDAAANVVPKVRAAAGFGETREARAQPDRRWIGPPVHLRTLLDHLVGTGEGEVIGGDESRVIGGLEAAQHERVLGPDHLGDLHEPGEHREFAGLGRNGQLHGRFDGDARDQGPVGLENLDTIVPVVGDVDAALRVAGDVGGHVEVLGVVALLHGAEEEFRRLVVLIGLPVDAVLPVVVREEVVQIAGEIEGLAVRAQGKPVRMEFGALSAAGTVVEPDLPCRSAKIDVPAHEREAARGPVRRETRQPERRQRDARAGHRKVRRRPFPAVHVHRPV